MTINKAELLISRVLLAWQRKCAHKWKNIGGCHQGNDYTSYQYKCEWCRRVQWFDGFTSIEQESVFNPEGFFKLLTWAKTKDWYPHFLAFSVSVCAHGLDRIIESLKDDQGFANCDYWEFPEQLVDVKNLPIMLYHFKKYCYHRRIINEN